MSYGVTDDKWHATKRAYSHDDCEVESLRLITLHHIHISNASHTELLYTDVDMRMCLFAAPVPMSLSSLLFSQRFPEASYRVERQLSVTDVQIIRYCTRILYEMAVGVRKQPVSWSSKATWKLFVESSLLRPCRNNDCRNNDSCVALQGEMLSHLFG